MANTNIRTKRIRGASVVTASAVSTSSTPAGTFNLLDLAGKAHPCPPLVPGGWVTRAGAEEVNKYLRNKKLPTVNWPSQYLSDVYRLTWELQTNRGKFAKRYDAYVAMMNKQYVEAYRPRVKSYYTAPAPEDLATIGQMAQKFATRDIPLYFFVTRSCDDLGPSGFGHPGHSCWWDRGDDDDDDDDNSGRYVDHFMDHSGWGIVFGESPSELSKLRNGCGRLWAYQVSVDVFVVFNGYMYGAGDELRPAEVLAHALDGDFKRVQIVSDNNIHLNDAGYLIGPPALLTKWAEDEIVEVP